MIEPVEKYDMIGRVTLKYTYPHWPFPYIKITSLLTPHLRITPSLHKYIYTNL